MGGKKTSSLRLATAPISSLHHTITSPGNSSSHFISVHQISLHQAINKTHKLHKFPRPQKSKSACYEVSVDDILERVQQMLKLMKLKSSYNAHLLVIYVDSMAFN